MISLDGDVRKVEEALPPTTGGGPYDSVKRILKRYDESLRRVERAFLIMFSAFRLPVPASAFGPVFRISEGPEDIAEPLSGMSDPDFDPAIFTGRPAEG